MKKNSTSFDESLQKTLDRLNQELPKAGKPLGSYTAVLEMNELVFVSGQLPMHNKQLICGIVGETHNAENAQIAARNAGLMIISQLKQHFGTINNIERVLKLEGFVRCTSSFFDHPKVINGASNLMAEVFGTAGIHSRTAIGVSSLPNNALLEISAIFAIKK